MCTMCTAAASTHSSNAFGSRFIGIEEEEKKRGKKRRSFYPGKGAGTADKIRGQLYTRGTSYIDRNAILRVGRPEALPLNVSGLHGTNIIIRRACVSGGNAIPGSARFSYSFPRRRVPQTN